MQIYFGGLQSIHVLCLKKVGWVCTHVVAGLPRQSLCLGVPWGRCYANNYVFSNEGDGSPWRWAAMSTVRGRVTKLNSEGYTYYEVRNKWCPSEFKCVTFPLIESYVVRNSSWTSSSIIKATWWSQHTTCAQNLACASQCHHGIIPSDVCMIHTDLTDHEYTKFLLPSYPRSPELSSDLNPCIPTRFHCQW